MEHSCAHERRALALPRRGAALLLVAVSLLTTACGSDSSVTTAPTQVKCQVTLAATVSTMSADGGAGAITVTTSPECPWDVRSSAAWVSDLSPSSGQGDGTVAFRIAPNPQPAAREGDIVVNDNHFRVAQQAAPCRFTLRPGTLALDATGGTADLAVEAMSGCSWSMSADAPWLSLAPNPAGSGNATVRLTLAPNPNPEPRTATISLADQRATVTQAGASATPCLVTVSPGSQSFPSAGGPGTIGVATPPGCDWSATSTAPWVTITSGGRGSGDGQIGFSVAANSGAARTATIAVGNAIFTVAQSAAGPVCVYTLGATTASIADTGGNGSVVVTSASGCAWTANSSVPWITVTSGNSGSATGTVTFAVAANTGAARTGTLVVAGQTFAVTQAAAPAGCTYALAPASSSQPDTGGSGTFAVASAGGCAWTAASGVPWITITAGTSGSGNGTVGFTVAANTGAARTGTITAGGQTYTVTQAAAPTPCLYALTPAATTMANTGGSGTFAVSSATGCTWTAASDVAWISVTAGGSGTGNGTVAFTVAANTGPARTGTITVAGQTFTVSQAAAPTPCVYTLSPTSTSLPNTGGTGTFAVASASGCTWTSASGAAWISVTSGASGTGNGSVSYSVAANTGAARTGTITAAGQTFTVTQAAAPPPCSFSIAPSNVTLSGNNTTGTVAVATTSACAWTAVSNDSWIVVTSGASGTGNGTVAFSLTKLPSKKTRVGTITIAGRTFTVTQKD